MWEHFAPGGAIRVGGHHFAGRFLNDGAHIAWCVGPVSPVNFLKSNDETRARMDLWRRGGSRLDDGRMFAYAPMTWLPWRRRPILDSPTVARLTLRATWPRFRDVLARAGFARPDLLWMEPGAPLLALLDGIPHTRSVYRMCDDTAAFPDTPRSFARIEEEVCRRVDLVLATARSLERRARSLGARSVVYLPTPATRLCSTGPVRRSQAISGASPGRAPSTPEPSTPGSMFRSWPTRRGGCLDGASS